MSLVRVSGAVAIASVAWSAPLSAAGPPGPPRAGCRTAPAAPRVIENTARFGPRVGPRPWRIAAGLCLGASMGVKWSALYTLIGFAALALAWDVGARRTGGARMPVRGALRRDLPAWSGCYILLPIVTFLATWMGWFITDGGYNRHRYGDGFLAAWHGWWDYQQAILDFHRQLATPHVAQSTPLSWLVLGRPMVYDYKNLKFGEQGCRAAGGCTREVLALGNPAVWWVGTAALVTMLALWVSRRGWRAALALGPRVASDTRRLAGALSVGVYLIAVVLMFAYFYPILAAQMIPLDAWRARMWFPGWIVAK